ncbi:hypothetical protein BDL97_02G063500 [Sphagnum fallax]|nr:hypothetical protein BDL97_02G063500 [Sphagnum fallax]
MAGLGRVKEISGLGLRVRGLIRAANGLSVSSQSHSQSSSALEMETEAEKRMKRTQVLECKGERQANDIKIADGKKKSSEILESEAAMMDQVKRVRSVEAEANFAKAEESAMAKHIKSLIQMVGVWCMCLWHQMGQPNHVHLVELGPGRGTLMADLLRGTAKFTDFSQTLSVHMVECSPALKSIQQETLKCCPKDQTDSTSAVDSQKCKPTEDQISQISGAVVSWHLDLEHVPRGVPTIIIAHEFYDALPIHQFQRTPRGWCEKLVDVAEGSGQGFRFVLSPGPTTASSLYLAKRMKWASLEEKAKIEHVEVCPSALKLTAEIARRVGEDGGGALVVDYGEDVMVSDSLQAIRKHEFVKVLQDPGSADLSAYVDFAAIKHAVEDEAAGSSAFGPVCQSQFLGALGINFRLEALLQNATEEQAEALQLGYWRLVGDGPPPWLDKDDDPKSAPTGMGSRYKALAIVSDACGVPIGFQ